MDMKVKNMFEVDTADTADKEAVSMAPRSAKGNSRSAGLYDIMQSLGNKATLNQIWAMIPASDLDRPKNKQQLREWIGRSATSKGYFVKIKKDHYRMSTKEEYDRQARRNQAALDRYRGRPQRVNTQREKQEPVQPTVQKVERQVERQIERQAPPLQQTTPPPQFAQQYLGALLGTTCAIVLFYMVLKVAA